MAGFRYVAIGGSGTSVSSLLDQTNRLAKAGRFFFGAHFMPAGRPSTYSPAYCEEVISFMGQGYSLAAFAGEIGVARSTINYWMEANPEFSEAVKKAKAKCALEWERRMLETMRGGQFKGAGAATLCMFGLKNMAADDWADRASVNHTSSDGSMSPKPGLDVSKLSTEALAEIVAASNEAGSSDD